MGASILYNLVQFVTDCVACSVPLQQQNFNLITSWVSNQPTKPTSSASSVSYNNTITCDCFERELGCRQQVHTPRHSSRSLIGGNATNSQGTAHGCAWHAGTARSRPILTSLPLQVFIYFGGWWDVLFWVVSILVFIYKGKCLRLNGNIA